MSKLSNRMRNRCIITRSCEIRWLDESINLKIRIKLNNELSSEFECELWVEWRLETVNNVKNLGPAREFLRRRVFSPAGPIEKENLDPFSIGPSQTKNIGDRRSLFCYWSMGLSHRKFRGRLMPIWVQTEAKKDTKFRRNDQKMSLVSVSSNIKLSSPRVLW